MRRPGVRRFVCLLVSVLMALTATVALALDKDDLIKMKQQKAEDKCYQGPSHRKAVIAPPLQIIQDGGAPALIHGEFRPDGISAP